MPKTGTRNGARNADQKCQQNATRQPKKASQPAKDCKPNPVKKIGPKTELVPKMSTTRQRFVTFRCLRFLGSFLVPILRTLLGSVLVLKAGTLIGSSGCAGLGIIQVSRRSPSEVVHYASALARCELSGGTVLTKHFRAERADRAARAA